MGELRSDERRGLGGRHRGWRIDSLVRFGFDRADIEAFLNEHEGGQRERLTWLEERREAASELEDRIAAFSQHSVPGFEALEPYNHNSVTRSPSKKRSGG